MEKERTRRRGESGQSLLFLVSYSSRSQCALLGGGANPHGVFFTRARRVGGYLGSQRGAAV